MDFTAAPAGTPRQSTLWQDLAAVRESSVLERLTPEECKYQEVSQQARVHKKGNSGVRRGCVKSLIAF